MYEPQSLEAPKGFPQAGPIDGKIALQAANLVVFWISKQPIGGLRIQLLVGKIHLLEVYSASLNKQMALLYY